MPVGYLELGQKILNRQTHYKRSILTVTPISTADNSWQFQTTVGRIHIQRWDFHLSADTHLASEGQKREYLTSQKVVLKLHE